MEDSILISTKQTLGLSAEYTVFDPEIITHINTTFFSLTQLGIGPPDGFHIEDSDADWSDFVSENNDRYFAIRSYMFLGVKMLFDPPATGYAIAACEKQMERLEWRLSVERESTDWVDPNPPKPTIPDFEFDWWRIFT